MVKAKEGNKGFLVVTEDDHESILYETNTIEQARRIVQLLNAYKGLSWDGIHEIMTREGFYL